MQFPLKGRFCSGTNSIYTCAYSFIFPALLVYTMPKQRGIVFILCFTKCFPLKQELPKQKLKFGEKLDLFSLMFQNCILLIILQSLTFEWAINSYLDLIGHLFLTGRSQLALSFMQKRGHSHAFCFHSWRMAERKTAFFFYRSGMATTVTSRFSSSYSVYFYFKPTDKFVKCLSLTGFILFLIPVPLLLTGVS